MDTVQATKQRFEIIGNDLEIESRHRESDSGCLWHISISSRWKGVGKESNQNYTLLSHRKHGKYFSKLVQFQKELLIVSFGHEKGLLQELRYPWRLFLK
jgi:hypothetical protein